MENNYYEVEFGRKRELNDDNFVGYPDRHSVCILADHAPTLEEIEKFCKFTMNELGYDAVCSVKEIDYDEANEWFGVNADTTLPFLSSKGNENNYGYIEVEFGKQSDPADSYSICILADHFPTVEEARNFCEKDMKKLGYDTIRSVLEICEEEAHSFFDMENEKDFPILTFSKSIDDYVKESYETYKQNWIEENVDNGLQTATEACYENSIEVSSDMTFEAYVEKFGYADGSCYYSFDEYKQNGYIEILADKIEDYIHNSISELDETLSAYISKAESDKSYEAIKDILKYGNVTPLLDYLGKEKEQISIEQKDITEKLNRLYAELTAYKESSVSVEIDNIFSEKPLTGSDLTKVDDKMYIADLYGQSAHEAIARASLHNEQLADLISDYDYSNISPALFEDPNMIIKEEDNITRMYQSEMATEFYIAFDNTKGYEVADLHFCVLDRDIDISIPLSNAERDELICAVNDNEHYVMKNAPVRNPDDYSQSTFWAMKVEDYLYKVYFMEYDTTIEELSCFDANSRQNTFENIKAIIDNKDVEAFDNICFKINSEIQAILPNPNPDKLSEDSVPCVVEDKKYLSEQADKLHNELLAYREEAFDNIRPEHSARMRRNGEERV